MSVIQQKARRARFDLRTGAIIEDEAGPIWWGPLVTTSKVYRNPIGQQARDRRVRQIATGRLKAENGLHHG